jgi:hypothetical protein
MKDNFTLKEKEENSMAQAAYDLIKNNQASDTEQIIEATLSALHSFIEAKLSPLAVCSALAILENIGKDLNKIIEAEIASGKQVN